MECESRQQVRRGLGPPVVPDNGALSRFRPSGLLDWTFAIALIFKGLDGLLEMVGGVLLLVVSRETLVGWVIAVTQHELSEDPRDLVSTHVLAGAQHLSGSS